MPCTDLAPCFRFLLELETSQDPVLVFLESQRSHVRLQTTKTYDNCTAKIDVARADTAGDLARGDSDKARGQDLAACLRQLRSTDSLLGRRTGGKSWMEIQHFVRAMCYALLRHLPAAARVLKQYTSGNLVPRGTTQATGMNPRVAAQGTSWQRESIVEFVSLLSHYFVLTDVRAPQGTSMGPLPDWVPEGTSCFTAGVFMRSTLDELDDTVTELEAIITPEVGGEQLSNLLANMRYRFVDVLCTLWLNDARILHRLEDWTPDTQPTAAEAGTTLFMRELASAHRTAARLAFLVAGGKEVPGASNAGTSSGSSSKAKVHSDLAQRIRSALTDSLRASLDGIKLITTEQYEPAATDMVAGVVARSVPGSGVTIDVSSGETRLLLSVLNVQYIKDRLLPALLAEVGANLQVSLSEVGRTLRSRATAVDNHLFEQYVSTVGAPICQVLRDGILDPQLDWQALPPPAGVHAFIYEALLALVEVHAHVRTVTAAGARHGAVPETTSGTGSNTSTPGAGLVERTLTALVERLARETLQSFQKIRTFGMGGMLQATLEIEFLHQTLAASVTPTSEATLRNVYETISERYTRKSPDEASRLQTELESVKRTLVAARKATALQFLCFRRPRHTSSTGESGERDRGDRHKHHQHHLQAGATSQSARERGEERRDRAVEGGSSSGQAKTHYARPAHPSQEPLERPRSRSARERPTAPPRTRSRAAGGGD